MSKYDEMLERRKAGNQRAYDDGKQWPLCAVCGKTLDNPKFGGASVPWRNSMAHEECAKVQP